MASVSKEDQRVAAEKMKEAEASLNDAIDRLGGKPRASTNLRTATFGRERADLSEAVATIATVRATFEDEDDDGA
jgi:hypothetical protein